MPIHMRFLCFSMLLMASLLPRAARAEAPWVSVANNAPGVNTVHWSHPATPGLIVNYLVERQTPPDAWLYEVPVGSHVDFGLTANTTYNYRVCELDEETTCSPWNSVTTMPEPAAPANRAVPTFTRYEAYPDHVEVWWSGSSHYHFFQLRQGSVQYKIERSGTTGYFDIRGLAANADYGFIVQGCIEGVFNSSCSQWSAPLSIHTPAWPAPPPPPPPSDDGVIYGISDTGALLWYRHDGRASGSFTWAKSSGAQVGSGWDLERVFSGGDGVIYGITHAGALVWYRHDGRFDGTFTWAKNSGAQVGSGWDFKHVFAGSDGVIYGITDDGALLWYRHDGRSDGSFKWAANSGAQVGSGWDFKQVFSAGGGVIYGITEERLSDRLTMDGHVAPATPAGDLLWYRHDGRADGSFKWAANSGAKVGSGWDFKHVFAGVDGVIYGVTDRKLSDHLTMDGRAPATPGGALLWYRHDGRVDGTFRWAANSGAKVGSGWQFSHLFSVVR